MLAGLIFNINVLAEEKKSVLDYTASEDVENDLYESTKLTISNYHKEKLENNTYKYRVERKKDKISGRTYYEIINTLEDLPKMKSSWEYFDPGSKETKQLLTGILAIESGFVYLAVSDSKMDCRGIAQFCAPTAADIKTPCSNLVDKDGICSVCESYSCSYDDNGKEEYCWCEGKDNRFSPEISIPAALLLLEKKMKYIEANCPVSDETEMKKMAITAFNSGEGAVCRLVKSVGDDATLNDIIEKSNVTEIKRYTHSVIYAALEIDIDYD